MAGNGEGGEGWQKMMKGGVRGGIKWWRGRGGVVGNDGGRKGMVGREGGGQGMVGIEGGEGLHAYLMEYKRRRR